MPGYAAPAARARGQGRPGGDLRLKLPLTLEEVAEGSEKKLKVRKYVTCGTCTGTGAEGGSVGSYQYRSEGASQRPATRGCVHLRP